MSTVFDPSAAGALAARLHRLTPDADARWGRMTPHQAVVHLADSFRMSLGELETSLPSMGPLKYVLRFAAFTLPLPWPKGVKTAPELDTSSGVGTPPGDFAADLAGLEELLERFIASDGDLPPHPIWGRMSRGMAGRYAWRHVDHHLRQFGV